jgi:ribosomal protein L37E
MSLLEDDDCPIRDCDCTPWTCASCGDPGCSIHDEYCPNAACGFPRLHRYRDPERRQRLERQVDQILRGKRWKQRWHEREES